MGQYTSISAIAAGLGSCCATGFVSLATAGTVDGPRGVRCLLLWVNMIFLACAVLFMRTSHDWLGASCNYVKTWGAPDLGICHCENVAETLVVECRQHQMVFRIGCAAEVVFLVLALMGISGCANGAGRSWPCMKFLILPVLLFFFFFVPNEVFELWRDYAGLVAAGFAVFQAVVFIDWSMALNTSWFEKARQGQMRSNEGESSCFKGLILTLSALFMAGAGYAVFYLNGQFPEQQMLIFGTLGVTFVLLIVSILECIKHGALLPSAAFMLFAQYLVWQAASKATARADGPPLDLEMALAAVALVYAAMGEEDPTTDATQPQTMELQPAGGDAEAGKAGGDRVLVVQAQAQAAPPLDACDFVRSCLTQSVATAYATAILVPGSSENRYALQLGALGFSVLLYGWSLVAPSILKNRNFDGPARA